MAPAASVNDLISNTLSGVKDIKVMFIALCKRLGITPPPGIDTSASTPSVVPLPVSGSTSRRHVPQIEHTGQDNNVGNEDEEYLQV